MLTNSIVLAGLIAWKLKKVWVVSIAGIKKVLNIRINHTNVLKIFRKIWRFFLFFWRRSINIIKEGVDILIAFENTIRVWADRLIASANALIMLEAAIRRMEVGGESALPVFCFSVVTSSRCHCCRVTHWICLCYVRDNSVTTKWRIKICCHAGKCLFIREFCVVVTTWQQKKEFFIGRECILVVVFLPSHFRCGAYSCVFLLSLNSAEI